jgi:hypothetical protein
LRDEDQTLKSQRVWGRLYPSIINYYYAYAIRTGVRVWLRWSSMLVWHVIDVVLLIHLTHKMGFPGVGFQESKKKKKKSYRRCLSHPTK